MRRKCTSSLSPSQEFPTFPHIPTPRKPVQLPRAHWQHTGNSQITGSWDDSGWRGPQEISSATPARSRPGQARLLRALSHLILKAFKDGGPRASETGQFLALPPISCAGSCLWSLFYLWCTFCCYSILPFLLLFFCTFFGHSFCFLLLSYSFSFSFSFFFFLFPFLFCLSLS